MSDIGVVVLAAGLGTRMKSTKPKVLFELCGEPMIIHILRKAYEISSDVSVVLSYQKELVGAKIKEIFPQTKIYEQNLKEFPGTAGALKNISLNSEKNANFVRRYATYQNQRPNPPERWQRRRCAKRF